MHSHLRAAMHFVQAVYLSLFVSRAFRLRSFPYRRIGDNDFSMRRVWQTPSENILVLWRNSKCVTWMWHSLRAGRGATKYTSCRGSSAWHISPNISPINVSLTHLLQKTGPCLSTTPWPAPLAAWTYERVSNTVKKKNKINGSKFISSFASAQRQVLYRGSMHHDAANNIRTDPLA